MATPVYSTLVSLLLGQLARFPCTESALAAFVESDLADPDEVAQTLKGHPELFKKDGEFWGLCDGVQVTFVDMAA